MEKPCPPETILEMVTRFVPPPPAAALQAVSGGRSQRSDNDDERRGEVIPFPTARAGRSASELDDEAEREIMSRLDEILPDTPMVGSRDAEEQVPFSASAAAPAVTSTQVTDEPSFGGESDDAIEIDLESDPIEESAAAPAAAPIERSEPEATKGPAAKTEAQTPKGPTRASRDASKGAPREPARPQALEIVPPPKRKSSISPFLLISLCIAVLALVVYWISTSR